GGAGIGRRDAAGGKGRYAPPWGRTFPARGKKTLPLASSRSRLSERASSSPDGWNVTARAGTESPFVEHRIRSASDRNPYARSLTAAKSAILRTPGPDSCPPSRHQAASPATVTQR